MKGFPCQQEWVVNLSWMQQAVLFAAVRAPDGIRKDHPVKVLMRWYRRSVLQGAFEGRAFVDPFEAGGGSFTGPFTPEHAHNFGMLGKTSWWDVPIKQRDATWQIIKRDAFDKSRELYLRHVDELPHHFQLHLMHAAEIIGYEHPTPWIAEWWRKFYLMVVNDAHLFPESREQMNVRLSDSEDEWRAREEVTAA
ncbi:hypothetical protein LB566_23355 [Mesorhizobium sp. CA13]|uniref:hypothetical protein n=1 Tax=Mesorhizobium sp. CA13 TaxID=2876643 RepID=UPI001CCE5933|nr:hypothetical protein [Mesorhizobium sp. CA13]MBZ9856733.1 hypothetical protein [Mesorhizobium sp. CA13]